MGLSSKLKILVTVLLSTALVSGCSDEDKGSSKKVSASTLEAMSAYSASQAKLEDVGCDHEFTIEETPSQIIYNTAVRCGRWIYEAGDHMVLSRISETRLIFDEVIAASKPVVAASDTPKNFKKEASNTAKVLKELMSEDFEPIELRFLAFMDPELDQAAYESSKQQLYDLGIRFVRTVDDDKVYWSINSDNADKSTPQSIQTLIDQAKLYLKQADRYAKNRRVRRSQLTGEAATIAKIMRDRWISGLEEMRDIAAKKQELNEALEVLNQFREAMGGKNQNNQADSEQP